MCSKRCCDVTPFCLGLYRPRCSHFGPLTPTKRVGLPVWGQFLCWITHFGIEGILVPSQASDQANAESSRSLTCLRQLLQASMKTCFHATNFAGSSLARAPAYVTTTSMCEKGATQVMYDRQQVTSAAVLASSHPDAQHPDVGREFWFRLVGCSCNCTRKGFPVGQLMETLDVHADAHEHCMNCAHAQH